MFAEIFNQAIAGYHKLIGFNLANVDHRRIRPTRPVRRRRRSSRLQNPRTAGLEMGDRGRRPRGPDHLHHRRRQPQRLPTHVHRVGPTRRARPGPPDRHPPRRPRLRLPRSQRPRSPATASTASTHHPATTPTTAPPHWSGSDHAGSSKPPTHGCAPTANCDATPTAKPNTDTQPCHSPSRCSSPTASNTPNSALSAKPPGTGYATHEGNPDPMGRLLGVWQRSVIC